MTTRVFRIGAHHTITDGLDAKWTPQESFADLGVFLDRVARRIGRECVILLSAWAADQLLRWNGAVPETQARLEQARAAGWNVSGVRGWTTFHREGHAVHVGVEADETVAERCPMISGEPVLTCLRLARWHELTGAAYHGTPGVAGISLMRRHAPRTGGKEPTWQSKLEHGRWNNAESDYLPQQWQRSVSPGELNHYDANRAYLSACTVAELPRYSLRGMGPVEFDPTMGGYWLVELPTWKYADQMPEPAGYKARGRTLGGWVTTPTLRLLAELTEAGHYGGFRIIDSYLSPSRRILRTWASILEVACTHWTPIENDPDGPAAIRATAKEAYREAIGLLGRPGGLVYRPDWRHTIIATMRANLWRKVWKIGQEGDQWPISITVDSVAYHGSAPLPVGPKLGQFKERTSNV